MNNDTICAISTPLSKGAISIVRLSGPEAFSIAGKLLHTNEKRMQANTIRYHHIYDGNEKLDEVLVSFFRAPKSYTTEDMVEINCHGGVYITRRIYRLLLASGCRAAEAGEFTRRAYLNGRIDLSEAEAANDMIEAISSLKAKSAMRGMEGSVERLLRPLLEEIKDSLAMIELNIDYPEYADEVQVTQELLLPQLEKWCQKMNDMLLKAESFAVVKDGIKTAIVGKPNVGKSSLLNALTAKEKAIVTDIAGTTRDLIEENVNIGGLNLHLIDTAGIRESDELIEQMGIERSRKAIEEADLVFLVLDASCELDEADHELLRLTAHKDRLLIFNKKDLGVQKQKGIYISAKNKDIHDLLAYLEEKYEPNMALVETDILHNERQIALMQEAKKHLQEAKCNLQDFPVDVVEEDISLAYQNLCDILGREYREDLIDHLFRHFCVGK